MKRLHTVTFLTLLAIAAVTIGTVAQVQTVPPRPPQMPPRDTGMSAPQPTGTGAITGTVTSVEAGRPMRRAIVRLQSTSTSFSRNTFTDERGNFEFKEIPAGDFNLRASKPGYLESIYGQKRPGSGRPGTPVSLKDGQRLEKLSLGIPKGGVLTGTILDDVGEPAFGVNVRAMRYVMRSGERTLVAAGSNNTDDRGTYRIPALPPGEYIVLATPPNDSAMAAEDEVRKMMEQMVAGGGAGGARVSMNAAGGVALGMPGASGDPGPSSGFAPVFYPSTTLAVSATTLTLGPAEEKPGLDIHLQIVPLTTITGTVIGDPRAVAATTIQLTDGNTGLPGLTGKTTRAGQDGKFTFTGIAPGQYTLSAKSGGQTVMSVMEGGRAMTFITRDVSVGPEGRGAGPGGTPPPTMWATADVSVDGRSRNDIALTLQSGSSVSGRVEFNGNGQPPTDFTGMRVLLASSVSGMVMSGSANATIDAEGKFKITDAVPGKYRVTATPPRGGGWRAKSVDVDAKDALDFLLEVKAGEDIANAVITFTNKATEIGGQLQDSSGQPTSDYTIILFAADQRFWTPQSRRIVSTRPSTDGKYSFRDLPPGDYRLVALEDAEPDAWFDPAFLKQLIVGSMTVTVADGEKKVQDIKVNR